MINDVIISRLNEIIGDFNTPFFNYLIYSYDFSFGEGELIVENIKKDILDNKVSGDNLVLTVESYFKSKTRDLEIQSKLDFLDEIIQDDSEFFLKYLKNYNLSADEIHVIYVKVKKEIINDNISDFEIKRILEYYFSNSVNQVNYLNKLDNIKGRNYDTLIIQTMLKKYPILVLNDIISVIFDIKSDIIGAYEFKRSIKEEFKIRCMKFSESKIADARVNLECLVEGNGDSFSKLVKSKNLTLKDGEIIVSSINEDINNGLIQPESINNIFLTNRFNEYINEAE